MLPRMQSIFLALVVALLIVFGTFGIFNAEASSFQAIISDAQSNAPAPADAYTPAEIDGTQLAVPGMPY